VRTTFAGFVVDTATCQLLREGRPIHLSPKAFELLVALLRQRPSVVSKQRLLDEVWPGTFVSDANLNVVVGEIRRALDDDPKRPAFIRTAHRRGYAFAADAKDLPDKSSKRARSAGSCWLSWNDRTFALTPGDSIIGRDPSSDIRLNASGVSRRHARIVVAADRATLEDLGSLNGTFLSGVKVTAPQMLQHGDVIHIGDVAVTFERSSAGRLPSTVLVKKV
jgi:DNA-binding winged helix-turn-helix (wHTH) protein